MTEARTELFNIDWRETSFVPAGDNPPARIVMWKQDAELTDDELEEIMAEVAAEKAAADSEARRQEMSTSETLTKQSAVAEATRVAKTLYPNLPEAVGRSKVWAEREDLRRAHARLAALPADALTSREEPEPAPVHKGATAFAKIDQAARQDLPDLYRRSPSLARTEVSKLRPELRDEYHEAHQER